MVDIFLFFLIKTRKCWLSFGCFESDQDLLGLYRVSIAPFSFMPLREIKWNCLCISFFGYGTFQLSSTIFPQFPYANLHWIFKFIYFNIIQSQIPHEFDCLCIQWNNTSNARIFFPQSKWKATFRHFGRVVFLWLHKMPQISIQKYCLLYHA